MSGRTAVVAVQITNHNMHGTPGRSGLVGLVIVLIGWALVVYGAIPLVRLFLWRSHALPARGSVVENVPHVSRHHQTSWSPIVEFEADGETIMSLLPTAVSADGWPLGQDVEVLYNPSDPHQAGLAGSPLPFRIALIAGAAIIGSYFALVP